MMELLFLDLIMGFIPIFFIDVWLFVFGSDVLLVWLWLRSVCFLFVCIGYFLIPRFCFLLVCGSLPSRLTKGTDLPAFGSSSLRNKDGVSNGSHTNSPRFTLSRFSFSTSSHRFEDPKTDYDLLDRTGALSSKFQEHGGDEALSFVKSGNGLSGNRLTKGEEDSLEESNGGGQFQFHFSIYKWASKGVPLKMPSRGNGPRLREKTLLRRSSSSTDMLMKAKNEMHSPTSTTQNIDFPPVFHETTKVDDEKGTDILPDMDNLEERQSSFTPSENLSRQSSRTAVGSDNISHPIEKAKPHSLPKKISSEKSERKMTSRTIEDQKHEAKSLSSFLLYSDSEQSMFYCETNFFRVCIMWFSLLTTTFLACR